MKAIVVGGGAIAGALASQLTRAGREVSFVVDSAEIARELSSRFPGALVIHGNGSREAALRDAQADDCDALFAVHEDDSHNMVTCLMARERFHIEHVVALASCREDEPAFDALDIKHVCIPDTLASTLIGVIEKR